MMPEVIKSNVEFLQARIKDYQERITALQESCPHEVVEGEYKADTGNYCPQDDSYWISAKCLDCHKDLYARASDDNILYRRLSMSGMIGSKYDGALAQTARQALRQKILDKRKEGA